MASTLPGAIDRTPWEKDRDFKAGGHMFARSGLAANSRDSFKVEDKRILELTDQPGICPASYLARAWWVQIDPAACRLPRAEMEQLVRRSYVLVMAGRLKKSREILQPQEDG